MRAGLDTDCVASLSGPLLLASGAPFGLSPVPSGYICPERSLGLILRFHQRRRITAMTLEETEIWGKE